ncbi:DUF6134 family protein [Nitrosomonadales bacterium]|nr:DUF6134 family protein [Nitrosomonadales bacterium]
MATKKLTNILILLLIFSNSLIAKEWNFDAVLNDRIIGQHIFKVENFKSLSKANFHIEFLFMDIYYKHASNESWNNGCLSKIDSKTDDDGDFFEVKGQLEEKQFALKANKNSFRYPACLMTFAYWDPNILNQSKLLNSQDGELLDVSIEFIANELMNIRQEKIMTKHYQLVASKDGDEKLKIQLWYDKEMNWVGLSSTTPIGDIFYKLL